MARITEMHKKWLKEPKYKKAYDALEEEFALALALTPLAGVVKPADRKKSATKTKPRNMK